MKLYDLTAALRRALDAIADGDGVDLETGAISDDALAGLTAAESAFDAKVEGVALYVRELTAESKAIKEEADRVAERAKARANAADRLKAYLLMQMQAARVKEVKGALATVTVQQSPPAVHVFDDTAIPTDFRLPQIVKFDVQALLAELKAGRVIPGAALTRGVHLRIR